jgi:hypothetical protein
MTFDDVLDEALRVKLQTDELIILGDKLYYCMECHQVTDWWKPGQVCGPCEQRGEDQFEMERGN